MVRGWGLALRHPDVSDPLLATDRAPSRDAAGPDARLAGCPRVGADEAGHDARRGRVGGDGPAPELRDEERVVSAERLPRGSAAVVGSRRRSRAVFLGATVAARSPWTRPAPGVSADAARGARGRAGAMAGPALCRCGRAAHG